MKADKNTIIGFVVLGIIMMGYLWYSNKQQSAAMEQQREKKRIEDSIALVNAAQNKLNDTVTFKKDSLAVVEDSANKVIAATGFAGALNGTEQLTVVENDLMKVTFTNKGAALKSVELKKYKALDDKSLVVLGGNGYNSIGYNINTSSNQATQTGNLYFPAAAITKNNDGSQTVTFTLEGDEGKSITHQYIIKPGNYMMDWNVQLQGADKLLTQNTMNVTWAYTALQEQASNVYERQQSRIYNMTDDYDYYSISNGKKIEFTKSMSWLSNKQQFFNATLLAKNKFKSGSMQLEQLADTSNQLYTSVSNLHLELPATASVTVPFQLYYGPNDYKLLKSYDNKMENIVDLGSGMFAFVKYINRWVIMPVFDFFAKFIMNFGWVIALLTIFIRVVTSPLTYSSYLSGAKMKVLRPELDELRKKLGGDQQAFGMEQMKLFREAGVNPLGGCIPALLQIPIFFSLYSFFSSAISLRGQSFLWAHDLSSYDVIAKLPFSIPAYGDHVSLFTLTAIITSFLISFYNMASTPDTGNPAMKYMPYIFPFILLFVFNRLPAALTWYYTVSNVITLIIQFIIQKFIIDHDKILAKMDETRKKPKKVSKWQERYQQTMESQKKLQEMKQRTQNRK